MTLGVGYDESLAQIREKLLPDDRVRAVVKALADGNIRSAQALMEQAQKYNMTGVHPAVTRGYLKWTLATLTRGIRRRDTLIALTVAVYNTNVPEEMLVALARVRAVEQRAWCLMVAAHGMDADELERAFGCEIPFAEVMEDFAVSDTEVTAEIERLEQSLRLWHCDGVPGAIRVARG